MFAERYHLQFSKTPNYEKDDLSGENYEEIIEGIDELENELETIEIDQASDLYKTIVAAIMEDKDTPENSDVMDWTMDEIEITSKNHSNEVGKI